MRVAAESAARFALSRCLWGFKSAQGFVITVTILYVLFFAKYGQFNYHQRDVLIETSTNRGNSQHCPKYPSTLKGVWRQDLWNEAPSVSQIQAEVDWVQPGGTWRPDDCRSSQKVAIIIPYRSRWPHLRYLLRTLHPVLHRQLKHYRIYVIEQAYNEVFNKGLIMNIGFSEALKDDAWDCFIFHDVDMLPQNDYNLYECGPSPRHLSPALDEMRFNLIYPTLVGGVLALTEEQVRKVNGFSNLYWGWGAEDDDMSQRIRAAQYQIQRPPNSIGRYSMILHEKRELGLFRLQLFLDWERWPHEGINSLHTHKYTVLSRTPQILYTNITVDIGAVPDVPVGQKPQTLLQSLISLIYVFLNI